MNSHLNIDCKENHDDNDYSSKYNNSQYISYPNSHEFPEKLNFMEFGYSVVNNLKLSNKTLDDHEV